MFLFYIYFYLTTDNLEFNHWQTETPYTNTHKEQQKQQV